MPGSASCATRCLILGIVPLAMLGGLIALHVTGDTLNVATAVGFIALVRSGRAERHNHGRESQPC